MLAQKKDQASMPREPFMAFVEDETTARSLENCVQERGWNASRVIPGGWEAALSSLQEVATPEILIVDFSQCDDLVGGVTALAEVCEPGVRLICLGVHNDVQLYRTLLDMGVDDYLLKPVDAASLNDAIEKTQEAPVEEAPNVPDFEGEVISVIGAGGGCGTSVIAQNLAWDAAYRKQKKTVLVDLDLHFGVQALALDVQPGKGFREALQSPSRIDSLFLERAVIKRDTHFHLLASEVDMDQSVDFEADALGTLLAKLREQYEVVVIDLPRHLVALCLPELAKTGKTLLLSDMSLRGMRDSLRLLRIIRKFAEEDNFFVVTNRAGENKDRELSRKEFEAGIEHKLDDVIPFDGKSFARAEVDATALDKVAAKGKATQALHGLGDVLLPSEPKETAEVPLWRKLFSK